MIRCFKFWEHGRNMAAKIFSGILLDLDMKTVYIKSNVNISWKTYM